jgi:polyisoprenoid-binding protein YceI
MQIDTQKRGSSEGQTVWRIDPSHTTAEFSIATCVFFTVKGQLAALEGTIVLDDADITRSSVIATLKADSLATGITRRDKHLRSGAFLDASNYPTVLFQSLSVGPGNDRDMLKVKGSLTIRGRSVTVELDVNEVDRSRSPQGEEVVYYCATTNLDRFDFGIRYGRGVIARAMRVTINVQASRPL